MLLQGLIAVLTVILGVEIYIGLNVMEYLHLDCRNITEQLNDKLNEIRIQQEVIQEVIHEAIQEVKRMQERTNDKIEKTTEDWDFYQNKTDQVTEELKEIRVKQVVIHESIEEVKRMQEKKNGEIAKITEGNIGFEVRCDMDTAPGGWTVFQRRVSASDFYKIWNEYQVGFGNISDNFWLGNQQIHLIVSQGWYQLRIDMTNLDDKSRYAEYQMFFLGSAESQYKLFVDGFSGNAGDSLSYHHKKMFSTKDRDNDDSTESCAQVYIGAWWYTKDHASNLNGNYGNTEYGKGPVWYDWMGMYSPLKKTEMKIRRWDHTQ